MKKANDENLLSAYIDGELGTEDMQAAEQIIATNASARGYVLDAVKSGARLRSAFNPVLEENVPARLINSIMAQQPQSLRQKPPVLRNLIRIAAAVVLLLTGFLVSQIVDRTAGSREQAFVEPLSGPYRQVVDAALENVLSGTSHEWRNGLRPVTVRVTPLKTYRDKAGIYYREYRLEVKRNNQTMHVNGLAYRAAKGSWKTKALYF
jgi:anti-sigma factor RsiW